MRPYSPDDAAKVAPLDEADAKVRGAAAVEWTDAEREAVGRAIAAWTLDDAEDPETQIDTVLDALAPFAAAREAQAAAKALREAADDMQRVWVDERRTLGMATDDWLRSHADRIERGES